MRVPLYKCEVCEYPLDPKDSSVYRLMTGWVKGTSMTIKSVETNHFRYIHEACKSAPIDENQLPLF